MERNRCRPDILYLPHELIGCIASHLQNRDLKCLRLACRQLSRHATLRFYRVFISANPRNIEVFRTVADHAVFRKTVVEIFWDDARFRDRGNEDELAEVDGPQHLPPRLCDGQKADTDHVPAWFLQDLEDNMATLLERKGMDRDFPRHVTRQKQIEEQMPPSKAWATYCDLLLQQDQVLRSGADIEAFKYGLSRFPALRRVTVSPAVHGYLFTPLYQTPMMRMYPAGFNYPIPRGWPTREMERQTEDGAQEMPTWTDNIHHDTERIKNKWRGFRVVTRLLADAALEHKVTELVVDAHELATGVNCRIFEQECDEQADFAAVLRFPGFRRLDLSLNVEGQQQRDWPAFRSGHLGAALAAASKYLEHFSLDGGTREYRLLKGDQGVLTTHTVPLLTFIPVLKWPSLRHFGLSRLPVLQADVMHLLAALPETIRTVHLSCLTFQAGESYRSLMEDMRDTLGWKWRIPDQRPSVSISVRQNIWVMGRAILLGQQVDDFLYENGPNPFHQLDYFDDDVLEGSGAMVRDAFEPEFERPHDSAFTLVRMGFLKEDGYVGAIVSAYDNLKAKGDIDDGVTEDVWFRGLRSRQVPLLK
ncbi:hypothetical protein QQS21_000704 [Conoideocrella luteorostrata]|uniref:F-box domain-containing protein n=1 Tax=Conoideocrella luteorostrata TaxID=1105319 RepID=A0AAJ0CZ73_9HYPO|nr:hypothetical protein QQS21_000704 [Conoideocrella luteorostrata]